MYEVSNNYLSKIYNANIKHLLTVYIDGEKVDEKYIGGCSPSHYLFTDNVLKAGSVTSMGIDLELHRNAILNKKISKVYIETGIDGEIIPVGIFNLDKIAEVNKMHVKMSLYDNMIKFESKIDVTNIKKKIDENSYITLGDLLLEICNQANVECGSKNFDGYDKQVTNYDNSISLREVLSYIAEQAGGFATIGRDGKLYIRNFGESVIELPLKYFKDFKWGEKITYSRVNYQDGTRVLEKGDLTNSTLFLNPENLYIVDQSQIDNIFNKFKDFELYGFTGTSIIDPAIDVGDILIIDGKKVLYQGSKAYAGKWQTTISSNLQLKSQQETTTQRISQKVINRTVKSSIDQVKGLILLQASEIDENSSKIAKLTLSSETFELNLKKKLDKTSLITEFNASAEKIEMKSNRISIASNYFTLSNDGKITATSGSIAGINFSNQGLFYSGSNSNDGFGLWKNGVHSSENSYIIFHAGANNGNIGSANFRVYQNGTVYASLLKIVSNKTTATGIEITGTEPFVDFKAKNSSSYTTRIIDYGNQLIIASDSDLTIANRGNSAWRSLRCSRVYLENDNNFVWSSDNSIYISTGGNVNFTNQNNNGYISLFAGRYHIDGDSVLVWQTNGQMLLSSSTGVSVVTTNNSAYLPILASAFTKNSSRRYKENIVDMSETRASKILELETKVFDYNEESKMNAKNVSGLIAEDVAKIISEAVVYREIDGNKVPDSIDYTSFIPYLIKEVQILNKKLEKLEGRQ